IPLTGGEHELGLVIDRWRRAKTGEGQAVLLTGEAGIGKSRLLLALPEQLRQETRTRLRYQCSPRHISSALWPIIQQLERTAGFERDATSERKLEKLEALLGQAVSDVRPVAPLIASLLSIEDGGRYPSLNLSPQAQKRERSRRSSPNSRALRRSSRFSWFLRTHIGSTRLRSSCSMRWLPASSACQSCSWLRSVLSSSLPGPACPTSLSSHSTGSVASRARQSSPL